METEVEDRQADVGRDELFGRGEKDDDVGVEKPDSGGRWMDGRTDGRAVTDDRPRETRRHQEDKKKEAMKAEKFWSTRRKKEGRKKKVSLCAKYVIQRRNVKSPLPSASRPPHPYPCLVLLRPLTHRPSI